MNAIKFDEKKVRKSIEAYRDQNGKYPYLICSTETRAIIPSEKSKNGFHITADAVSANYLLGQTEIHKSNTWYKAKILTDDSLPFGEVHIG